MEGLRHAAPAQTTCHTPEGRSQFASSGCAAVNSSEYPPVDLLQGEVAAAGDVVHDAGSPLNGALDQRRAGCRLHGQRAVSMTNEALLALGRC